ncbi:glycosyltransferase [Sphingobacterium zeae]|uniref:Glycosyltransferase involved in cell wall biosynthesis n=1 Tax=Sphingobacterium zeae TaxID=1776859 RepID=A0ABU0TZM6_9SPHI|nr:glycosyltransferase [Sphingobacterium zeae]MDQ1148159.1 glycosyltransferase involved in cell wall biosynthesis [Sphingobacterium zeae]
MENICRNLKEPLISIIIPVYNVEPYLSECLTSVIDQTYSNLEIILVNDGSTDGSGNICAAYAKNDVRIKIINKTNGGLSDARNKGLDLANGEYVSFVDSDDVIDKNFICNLLQVLLDSDASIAMCDYTNFTSVPPTKQPKYDHSVDVYTGEYMLNNLYNPSWIPKNVIAWNKLYKISVWNNLRYTVGVLHEDEYIIHELYANTNRLAYTREPLYFYRQREASITKKISQQRINDTLAIFDLRESFFKTKGYNHLINPNYQAKLLNIGLLAITYEDERARKLLTKHLSSILLLKNLSARVRLSCFIIAFMPALYWKIKKIKNMAL